MPCACPNPVVEQDAASGTTFCTLCGTVFEENAIVAEVGFQEGGDGRHTAIGSRVTAANANRHGGPGFSRSSRETSAFQARQTIVQFATALGVGRENVVEMANRVYNLAFLQGLTKGRPVARVCAVCLYIALRKEQSPVMLIELADLVQVSVFKLGTLFMLFRREFPSVAGVNDIDPSIYIARFAAALGFGNKTRDVANDALKLVARMKRDWIADGRRPAGICGAALLIAARLHNFHRSIKELIQLVKMSDNTLKTRLREFERTPAAQMSAAEFRDNFDAPGVLGSLPPSFLKHRVAEMNEGSEGDAAEQEASTSSAAAEAATTGVAVANGKRKRRTSQRCDGDEDEDDEELDSEERALADEIRQNARALMAAAAAMPTPPSTALSQGPASSQLQLSGGSGAQNGTASSPSKRRRRSPAMSQEQHQDMLQALADKLPHNAATTGEFDPAESASTDIVPPAMTAKLADILPMSKLREQAATGARKAAEEAAAFALEEMDGQGAAEAAFAARAAAEVAAEAELPDPNRGRVKLTDADMRLSDLDDDDEVAGVLVTEEEAAVRSALWHTLNREYLQEQLEKEKLRAAQGANGGARRKRRNTGGNGGRRAAADEYDGPAATAAEAVQRMARRKISTKVNKDHLEALFNGPVTPSMRAASHPLRSPPRGFSSALPMEVNGVGGGALDEEVAIPGPDDQQDGYADEEYHEYDGPHHGQLDLYTQHEDEEYDEY